MAKGTSSMPNIVLIMADDMGFSDLGCYGSEIRTPQLDRLAEGGVRFSHAYNGARCCPARASLLTGLHPHQTGVAHMTWDLGEPGYRGFLNRSCVTIAEVLRERGYHTCMSGKWHVGGNYRALDPESWHRTAGDATHPTPTQRGFDRFYGILNGLGSFYDPVTLVDQERFVRAESPDFYFTDAVTDKAIEMVQEASDLAKPFFLYLAYTAPHWPLHALEEDIARYEGRYLKGWDEVRTARHEEMKGMGILDSRWPISPRDQDAPPWTEIRHREWEDQKMGVYAAQLDRVDQGIGRLMARLRELGQEENTLVVFLSDNGGCAEFLLEEPGKPDPSIWGERTRDGRPMRVGNITGLRPGGEDTFMTYDLPWTNVSNAPFRLFKHWVHEGGIATPLIVHWPAGIRCEAIVHQPVQLVDITATLIDAAGASYPAEHGDHSITPLAGESFLPLLEGQAWSKQKPLFFEHEGNRAVRYGRWKLVSENKKKWELYDMVADRTELNDLAEGNGGKVRELAALYGEWAEGCGVLAWPIVPSEMVLRMRGEHIHLSYHRGRRFYP
ncbi:MAG TPA: arylsulfatase [Spirochaetia bacterium]|nr:arylsulfatase [Spirochaetia bacterium]